MKRGIHALSIIGLLLLAACGSAASDTKNPGAKEVTRGASGWNPLDACATLGEEAAAKLGGAAVTSSELTTKVEGTDSSATFSMCTFSYDNGAKLALLTREAPDSDATAEAIEAARTSDGTMPPAVDVQGLGKAAMWSDTLKGLQVFLDGRRYLSINFYNMPGGADGKTQAIAVAKKLL